MGEGYERTPGISKRHGGQGVVRGSEAGQEVRRLALRHALRTVCSKASSAL